MKVVIHNNKFDDSIQFEVDEINEETRQDILSQVHARGWKDEDCWSEVEK